MLISIVIPVYCEENNIQKLYHQLEMVTSKLNQYAWEYIFVNDGSHDTSYQALKELALLDKKVKVIDLSRNFGKEIALTAGIEAAAGDAVITMDADLQHPPDLIPNFLNRWEKGVEIVSTIREQIVHPLWRRISSHIYYWLMKRVSQIDMISQTSDYRLLDRKVVDVFTRLTEKERFFRGLIDWMGFRKEHIEFSAPARLEGDPGYSFIKLLRLATSSFIAFSLFPLKLAGYLGIFITLISFPLLIIILFSSFILRSPFFSPISIVIVANTFLSGVMLICLGLIALYIGIIHNEVINRPLYLVREKINF